MPARLVCPCAVAVRIVLETVNGMAETVPMTARHLTGG
jgi:hypothetical protein